MKRPAVIVDRNKQTKTKKQKQKPPNKKQQQNVHVTLKQIPEIT